MVYQWIKNIPTHITPKHCPITRRQLTPANLIHPSARALLSTVQPACPLCSLPYEHGADAEALCPACSTVLPPYQRLLAACRYQSPADTLVQQLKFQGRLSCAEAMAELMAEAAPPTEALPEVLLPVPLHSGRLRERGFNQAAEIVKSLSHRLNIPMDDRLLIRNKPTPPQSDLSADQRKQNVKNAFEMRYSPKYQHVAVIDDVVTTGHTVKAVSRLLKSGGIKCVEVWCFARTPG